MPYERLMWWIDDKVREEDGATAVEYGLLAALIAVVMAVGAQFLGDQLSALFDWIGTKVTP